MKISYQILCKNEDKSLKDLLTFLVENKRKMDEINVCRDTLGSNPLTKEILNSFGKRINSYERQIKHTIHNQKNWLATQASGDYLFYLDADEMLSKELIDNIPAILEMNKNTDIIFFPRINKVEGATQEYIQKRGWNVNEKGWINFPDVQDRLFRNNCGIKYNEIPHGRLLNEGKNYSILPYEEEYSIIHIKTMEKQVSDNVWHDKKERELNLISEDEIKRRLENL